MNRESLNERERRKYFLKSVNGLERRKNMFVIKLRSNEYSDFRCVHGVVSRRVLWNIGAF